MLPSENERWLCSTTPPHSTVPKTPESNSTQKCLESILVTPTASYDKQVEENKRILNVKKLSNQIIMGKSTEETTMELDGEGTTNFEHVQDRIRKECDKRDGKYARSEGKYNKLEQQVTKKDPKNMPQRGHPSNNEGTGASYKNKFNKSVGSPQVSFLMCTFRNTTKIAVQVLLLLTLFTFTFEPFLKL